MHVSLTIWFEQGKIWILYFMNESAETKLEPTQTSTMELFCENS